MPFRKVQVSLKAREAMSRGSPSGQSAMGNRQLVPSAPPGRGRNSLLNRPTKKNGLALNKAVGDAGFQKKSSSGGITTVGTTGMIPFQRASRREPHVEPQATDGYKKMVLKKNDVSQKHSTEQHDNENNNPTFGNSNEKGISSASDSKTLPVQNNQKTRPADLQGGQSHTRSVRPKLKRPSVPKDQINSGSSPRTSNRSGATKGVLGANDRKPREVEVVGVSTTSPRRRIVRRKSQTLAAERKGDTNDVQLSSSIKENERTDGVPVSSLEVTANGDNPQDNLASSHAVENSLDSSRPMTRTRTQPLNQNLPESRLRTELAVGNDTSRYNSNEKSEEFSRPEGTRPFSRSRAQPLDQSLPENLLRSESTMGSGVARQTSNGQSENISRSSNEIPSEMLPRPLSSATVPLRSSLSRNGNSQIRFETGRPTIQPATAVATDLHESSQSHVTVGQERQPNSVRRSHERLGAGSDGTSMGERPRLVRQSVSSLTSRARPREIIDVNSAVSDLTTRVPRSPRTQPGTVGTNSRTDVTSSRAELDNVSTVEDIWVPQTSPAGRNPVSSIRGQTPNSSTHLPLSSEPSITPQGGRSESPDVVFRDSPVTGLLHRRQSRLSSSDNERYPSVRNTTRNAPTIPSRSGLYRALSVNDDTANDTNTTEINRTNTPSQNQRDTRTHSRIENIDHDDVVSWRQIEREHSYPSREPRQRLIYQDRNRGRETILNRNTSGHRVVPPSMDSVPDVADEQEFPPLGGSSSVSRGLLDGTTQVQASSGTGPDYGFTSRNRRSETPPPTPTPGRNPSEERLAEDDPMHMVDHLVLLASPIFGPLMLQASPAVLFNMLSRARRDFGGEFVELLIENVVLNLLAQHTFDATNPTQNNNGAPPPADQETIESLEKVTVTKQMVSEDAFCSICHCEYMLEEILDQLPCKHNFHNKCITVWLQKSGTCPVCRHKLYTDSVD
ncbi:E3 ubiquitin-protein ligase RNF12-like [Strongylocentrotus purpuratus]|uniref:RING-type E3 ubiquitin transferase n=1 Tax=Strongylocentrotus purpuratus TaxID=7668 RepID=A0A7M7NWF7_STRPU|nr:E3 ubiquitin-protein ligase RNF12-like [Strongylocentrotus purpuratus]